MGDRGFLAVRDKKQDALGSRIRALDDRVAEFGQKSDGRTASLRDDLNKVEEDLKTCRLQRDILAEKKQRELSVTESSCSNDLEGEKQHRKENHMELIKVVEDKSQAIHADLLTEKKSREEAGNRSIQQLRQEIAGLVLRTDQEMTKLQQAEANLNRKLNDETQRIEGLIQNEREKRESMQNTMLRLLENMNSKHRLAIRAEKKEREGTEELLVSLLENALASIERNTYT